MLPPMASIHPWAVFQILGSRPHSILISRAPSAVGAELGYHRRMIRGASARPTPAAKKRSLVRIVAEGVLIVAAAFAVSLLIQAYVMKTFVVPTGSMLPTIQLNDRILTNRLAYRLGEPEIGDVVVFENPDGDGPPLVKRVTGIEGQIIDVREGWLYLDGVKQEEPWVSTERRGEASLLDPVALEEGTVWLMGDNRVGSSDSRTFGPVPEDSLLGEALLVYWPPRSFGLLE